MQGVVPNNRPSSRWHLASLVKQPQSSYCIGMVLNIVLTRFSRPLTTSSSPATTLYMAAMLAIILRRRPFRLDALSTSPAHACLLTDYGSVSLHTASQPCAKVTGSDSVAWPLPAALVIGLLVWFGSSLLPIARIAPRISSSPSASSFRDSAVSLFRRHVFGYHRRCRQPWPSTWLRNCRVCL